TCIVDPLNTLVNWTKLTTTTEIVAANTWYQSSRDPMETRNKKTLEQFQHETHDQFTKVNDMFQQLMNEFQTIKHERHDSASGSRGKLILSGDKAKPYLKLQFPRFSGGDPTGLPIL
ncbi:hypothetical protein Tco_0048921, partial [Tanacetum coccineum]